MNPDPKSTSPDDPVHQQAADWVVRQERGLSAAEQDEFLRWLLADRRHGAAVAQQQELWRRLDQLGQWRPEHSPQPNRDLLAPRPTSFMARLSLPVTWRAVLAVAACAALVAFFWWRPAALEPETPSTPTAIAAIEQRTLEDGSIVSLNRGAEVRVRYSATERHVDLVKGEAHFTVAKNKARPFIVQAGGVAVRAVGTAFNVRLASEAVDVLVTEGVVQVSPPTTQAAPTPVSLSMGERTRVALDDVASTPQVVTASPEQVEHLLAWQPQLLDFTGTPLFGVVAEFNRRNAPLHLVIADPALANVEVSASLRSDNIEGFIRLLEVGFGVRAEREGETIHLRKAR